MHTTTTALHVVDQLQTQRPTVDPALAHLRGSLLVIETATSEGLPTPGSIYVDEHAVQITLDTADQLDAWALWLDTPIEVFQIGESALVVYTSAKTTVLGVPVVVSFSEVL